MRKAQLKEFHKNVKNPNYLYISPFIKKAVMLDWFYTLTSPEQVFWLIAIMASFIFLIVLVTTFLGGDTDIDGDFDGGAGFQFFTFKNGVAFFSIFGWIGIACLNYGMGLTTSILIASACGFVMMLIMAGIFYYVNRLTESGTMEYKNAVNMTGEVYLEVGKNRSKAGKVQINVQGSLREMEALTDENQDIKRGSLVTVVSVTENGVLIIKPLS